MEGLRLDLDRDFVKEETTEEEIDWENYPDRDETPWADDPDDITGARQEAFCN